MNDDVEDLKRMIEECEAAMGEVKVQMKEMLDERNEEYKLFQKALDDDLKAKALLEAAIDALSSFYKKNKIPLNLLQGKKGPEYSVDSDKAPSTTFGSSHGGRKSEGGVIVAILSMLVEDTDKEIA